MNYKALLVRGGLWLLAILVPAVVAQLDSLANAGPAAAVAVLAVRELEHRYVDPWLAKHGIDVPSEPVVSVPEEKV